jgi:peptidoglycan/xylan/chitin deacetylase (PgdA/CDA1 family)
VSGGARPRGGAGLRAGATAGTGASAVDTSSNPFRVALTFDAEHPDRPSAPGVEERLLDALDRLGVRTSFFVQGRWAEAYPKTAIRIPQGGHLVGNHSHYHARMPLFSARGLRSDIGAARDAILEHMGVDPLPWFRCPFGAGVGDQRVQAFVRAAGYRHVGWHVAGIDWPAERTGADVEEAVVAGALAHGDGCVVLLHAWPDRTEHALEGIVRRLRDAGAEFARIDELPFVPEDEIPDAEVVTPSPA